jgi:hypothetical protein
MTYRVIGFVNNECSILINFKSHSNPRNEINKQLEFKRVDNLIL